MTSSQAAANQLALVAVIAAVVVGLACSFAAVSPEISGTLVSATGAIPAGIGLYRSRKNRDRAADLARLRDGELRRPVALVVVILAVGLLAWDSLTGAIFGSAAAVAGIEALSWIAMLVTYAGAFVMAMYAGHYLGTNPYAMATLAVVGMLAARVVILAVTLTSIGAADLIPYYLAAMLLHVLTLGVVLLGVFVGRRRQPRFVAEKAARLDAALHGTTRDAPADADDAAAAPIAPSETAPTVPRPPDPTPGAA
ncbi:hypothetical protein [Microbacterium sp. CGR1]|uniref:hypothetical protein n=1 Tax=Microbacterium sp. CGR1 TaxID=1696072 RepID=UPI003DA33D42